jgi:hypothetical protein
MEWLIGFGLIAYVVVWVLFVRALKAEIDEWRAKCIQAEEDADWYKAKYEDATHQAAYEKRRADYWDNDRYWWMHTAKHYRNLYKAECAKAEAGK